MGASGAVTDLAIDGTRFVVGGRPAFLLEISAYAALGAPDETLRRDLDEIGRRGFNAIRVWATWAAFGHDVSVVDPEGRPREPFLSKLDALAEACDRRGLVLDVTLSRGNGVTGPARLQTPEALVRAVETIVGTLKPRPNWFLDLANERNIKDRRFVPFDELGTLRARVRALDPARLVTASHAGDPSKEEMREYLAVPMDFLAVHRPRHAASPRQTEARTRELLGWTKEAGREVPVHQQEPFRRDFGEWNPTAEDFVTDLRGARAGGAAGWCFHNGADREGRARRCFDMRERALFDQLDFEELKFLRTMHAAD
jgi:hypothetical protein